MKKNNSNGTGTTNYSPIIAVGEGWAYHVGHFLSEQRYGTTATCRNEQPVGREAICCKNTFTDILMKMF
jgi:hypothetical protein